MIVLEDGFKWPPSLFFTRYNVMSQIHFLSITTVPRRDFELTHHLTLQLFSHIYKYPKTTPNTLVEGGKHFTKRVRRCKAPKSWSQDDFAKSHLPICRKLVLVFGLLILHLIQLLRCHVLEYNSSNRQDLAKPAPSIPQSNHNSPHALDITPQARMMLSV